MPFNEVMHKFKHGLLHSGSKHGKLVRNRKQAIAIMLSEKREAGKGKREYKSHGIGPSRETEESMMKRKKR